MGAALAVTRHVLLGGQAGEQGLHRGEGPAPFGQRGAHVAHAGGPGVAEDPQDLELGVADLGTALVIIEPCVMAQLFTEALDLSQDLGRCGGQQRSG